MSESDERTKVASSALLGCPFCGSEGRVVDWSLGKLFCVECAKCDAQGPTKEIEADAIEAWNKRYIFGGDATDVAWCKYHGWQEHSCVRCKPNSAPVVACGFEET